MGDEVVESTKGIVKKFGENTTLHGIRGVCDGSSHFIHRVIWSLLVVLALFFYTAVTYTSVSSYFQYNTVTKISTTAAESLDFPAVTICDQNQIPWSVLQHYNQSTQDCLNKGLFIGLRDDDIACRHILEKDTIVDMLIAKRMELFDEMFLFCSFSQGLLDCRDYITPQISESGTCFTFMSTSMVKKHGPFKQTAPGYVYGLNILINTRVDDYYISSRDGEGVQVSIHDPKYFLSVADAFALQPGIEAYVTIQKSVKKTLNIPYSEVPCQENDDLSYQNILLEELGFSEYSYGGCRFDCLYDYSVEPCGCDLNEGDNKCSLLQYVNCSAIKINEYYQHYNSSLCPCLKLCTQVEYDYQVSMLSYPTPYTILRHSVSNIAYRSFDDLRKNMISLFVYFQNFEYDTVEQIPSKTQSEIIADVGGQLGLCLGASLITVWEILECLVLLIKHKLSSRRKVTMVKEFRRE